MDPLINMYSFLDVAILITLMILSVSFLFTAYRIIKGPTLGDRIIGLDMLVAVGIGFIAVIGVQNRFLSLYGYRDRAWLGRLLVNIGLCTVCAASRG